METKKLTEEELAEAVEKFKKTEEKGSFYDIAVKLYCNGFEIEAYLFLLATWNSSRFQFTKIDIHELEKKIEQLNINFYKMKDETFKTINIDKYKDEIRKIYETLSQIKGVEYTGAAKVMHLKNREVFVMWDKYIRGEEKASYEKLQIVKNGVWQYKKYGNDAEGYLNFLKDMQNLFKNINYCDPKNTFAKVVDEFNYVNITIPTLRTKNNKGKEEEKKERLLKAFDNARGIWEDYDEIDAIRKETKERWQDWQKRLEKSA